MPRRGITCIPSALKQQLLKDIEDAVPTINDAAVEDTKDEDNPKAPPAVQSVINLQKFLNSLHEC
jgi:hypothetical protein